MYLYNKNSKYDMYQMMNQKKTEKVKEKLKELSSEQNYSNENLEMVDVNKENLYLLCRVYNQQ